MIYAQSMLKSKDVVILTVGVVLSGIFAILLNFFVKSNLFRLNSFALIWIAILILFLIVTLGVSVLYMRVRESEVDLLSQSEKQKKLEEKLKIYERLSKLEAEVGYIRNEKRK